MESLNKIEKGRANEELVAKHLEKEGWIILHKNKKFFGVETDLIARKNKVHILVEVKSLSHSNYLENILNKKQNHRLQKVIRAFQSQFQNRFELWLATVSPSKEIEFFQIEEL